MTTWPWIRALILVAGVGLGSVTLACTGNSKSSANPQATSPQVVSQKAENSRAARIQEVQAALAKAGVEIGAAKNEVVKAQNAFAVKLYQNLGDKGLDRNRFFSPYSLFAALAMTAEGARGMTAEEMALALQLGPALRGGARAPPWNLVSLHVGLGALAVALNTGGSTGRFELRTANALWGDASFPFAPEFIHKLDMFYGTGGVRKVDFRGHPEETRQIINDWASNETLQRIQELLPPGSLNSVTRLVLTNAIYFNGTWAEPFDASLTSDKPFQLIAGGTRPVPLMKHIFKKVRYAAFFADGSLFPTPKRVHKAAPIEDNAPEFYPNTAGFQVLELPYNGGELVMDVLLPRSPQGLAALERLLSLERLEAWFTNFELRKVDVLLPKFQIDQGSSMIEALRAMGMKRAFITSTGGTGTELDGIIAEPNAGLFIQDVIHKAFVEVNEKGTEAAAVTSALIGIGYAGPPSHPFVPTFRADRPFLFVIRDTRSGCILFIGRYVQP